MRVYTKLPGHPPDTKRPFTLRQAYSGTNSWLGNGTYFLVNNNDRFAVRLGTLSGTNYTVLLETNAVYTGTSINTGGTGSALGTYFLMISPTCLIV